MKTNGIKITKLRQGMTMMDQINQPRLVTKVECTKPNFCVHLAYQIGSEPERVEIYGPSQIVRIAA